MASPKWIGLGAAAAIVAVALLTGWGFFLTITQAREIEKVLSHAARAGAERWLRELEGGIARWESDLLDELTAAAAGAPAATDALATRLEEFAARHGLVASPFVLDADYSYLYPPIEPEERFSPLIGDEPVPEEVGAALRLLWTGAPAGETRRALDSVYRAPEIAAPWRLRALAAVASLELRTGDAPAAADTYGRVFDEFPEELSKKSCRPSNLHLVLARAEALRSAGEDGRAGDLLRRTLEELAEGRGAGIAEKRFFVDRVRGGLGGSSGTALEPLLDAVSRRLEESRSAGPLRHWEAIAARIRLELASGDASGPRHFTERTAAGRRLIFWRRGPAIDGRAPAAIGYQATADELERAVDGMVRAGEERDGEAADGFRFRVFDGDGEAGAPDLPAVSLPGELSFLRLGVDAASWSQRLDEGRRPYRIAGALLPALGLGMILAVITFYASLRRERYLSRMKTDFVANVSHELKTPLALIRLFGETLSLGRVRDDARKKEYYDIITRESERLTHLINNVLDFASIEAERKSYDRFPTDLARVVAETVRTYTFHLEEKGFVLRTEVPESLPSCLADPDAVSQALINLLNNAVKYSSDRKEIVVRAAVEGDAIRISVADRGVGLPPEDLRRIFEGFYRSKATRKLGRRGSGLGLTLVQHIVRSHDGRVEVRSKPGEGSTFTLVFPLLDEPQGTARDGGR